MATYVNDAGTWRKLRNIYVNDAGTWRTIRYVWVNDAGTWRKVFQRGEEFTITAGLSGQALGYSSGAGSISAPASGVMTDGKTIAGIYDQTALSHLVLAISGFSSNPGSTYLTSIEANSTEFLASAASFSYSAGDALWEWPTAAGFSNGNSYSGIIILA